MDATSGRGIPDASARHGRCASAPGADVAAVRFVPPADAALAFAVYEGGRENIWAVWGYLEDGDTLEDIKSFYEEFS